VGSLEFFKATSGGKMESIEAATSSLHNRRSILIKDSYKEKIWVIHGSGVADTTRKSGDKCAKRINGELGFQYHIEEVDYADADSFVESLLNRKEPKIKKKTVTTPKKTEPKETKIQSTPGVRKSLSHSTVPKVPAISPKQSEDRIIPKADQDSGEGPEIKEFQISYYHDEQETMSKETVVQSKSDTMLIRDVLVLVQEYIKELDMIISTKPGKQKSSNILSNLSEQMLDIIYSD
jgi:hypothetical protein